MFKITASLLQVQGNAACANTLIISQCLSSAQSCLWAVTSADSCALGDFNELFVAHLILPRVIVVKYLYLGRINVNLLYLLFYFTLHPNSYNPTQPEVPCCLSLLLLCTLI